MPVNQFSPGRYGYPLTDEERARRHYQLYGTMELPPRGTGRGALDGSNFWPGVILGFIFGCFVLTATGRGILGAAGRAVETKIS